MVPSSRDLHLAVSVVIPASPEMVPPSLSTLSITTLTPSRSLPQRLILISIRAHELSGIFLVYFIVDILSVSC